MNHTWLTTYQVDLAHQIYEKFKQLQECDQAVSIFICLKSMVYVYLNIN